MKLYKIKFLLITFLILGFYFLSYTVEKKLSDISIARESIEEFSHCPLSIVGNMPKWLSGTLIRNGPVKIHQEIKSHFFDDPAMLHAFSFQKGEVYYTNKFLRSAMYNSILEGSIHYGDFAQNSSSSFFDRCLAYFFKENKEPIVQNANVNITKLADNYVALTEKPLPVKFDLETLQTLGVFNYQDQLPKKDYWESAHPHYDSIHHKTINYFIEFGWNSYYVLYEIEDNTAERKIIAKIPTTNPSYMHSFSVTDNYIILTEFPFRMNPLDLILKGKPFIKNFNWHQEEGTNFIVINRFNGSVVGNYKTNSFFSFHHANAFEKNAHIYIDMAVYYNADILTDEWFYQQKDKKQTVSPCYLKRFILDLDKKNIAQEVLLEKSCEFPRINESFDGKSYRYVYVAGSTGSNTLYKVDTIKKDFLYWKQENCIVGEPVFIAKPGTEDEDDGVILAIILDEFNYSSFLLVLDAKTFQEIGRAITPCMLQKGLHSQFFY